MTLFSKYLTMRDGVQIAIDVNLPSGNGPFPTILRLTRYHRRLKVVGPFRIPAIQKELDQHYTHRQRFLKSGYAWVDVCVRGSGASSGRRSSPWSEDEREDSRELLDWISTQTWSNGKIGARGISYDGTAAEFLMALNHPSLKAVSPRFSLFDVYEDIAFPGGIPLSGFTKNWSAFNSALDKNRYDEVFELLLKLSQPAREQLSQSVYKKRGDFSAASLMKGSRHIAKFMTFFVKGVAPVDEDPKGLMLKRFVSERTQNLDVHLAAKDMMYRDEPGMIPETPDKTIDSFSPHTVVSENKSSVAILNYGGWFDSCYARSAIKRFQNHKNHEHCQLILGPWKHGTLQNISAWNDDRTSSFDHEGELLKFFGQHLKGESPSRAKVKYFTIGEEKWKEANEWPPPFKRTKWFLHSNSTMDLQAKEEWMDLHVQGKHHSGHASRWSSLLPLLSWIHYLPIRGEQVLSFNSAPLKKGVEITGHPIVHIELVSTSPDPRIFVYLEDLAPDGSIRYVTEGQFRAIHRKIKRNKPRSHEGLPYHSFLKKDQKKSEPGTRLSMEFDLLPLSYLFQRGHRLRISLAGCDKQNFEIGPLGTHSLDLKRCWFDFPTEEK